MKSKKMLFAYILLLVSNLGFSQNSVMVSLMVDNTPTPIISEWQDRAEIATYTVTASGSFIGTEAKIMATLSKNGTVIAQTRYDDMPMITLDGTTQIFTAQDFFSTSALDINISVSDQVNIMATGMLPGGSYMLCVKLLDINQEEIFTTPATICAGMLITDYQMPELILPLSSTRFSLQQLPASRFFWSGVTPYPVDMGIKYIVKINEIIEDEPAQTAFDRDPGLIEEEVVAGTEFFLPSDTDFNSMAGKKFCWSVMPLRSDDTPYIRSGNGFVSIRTFSVYDPVKINGEDNDSEFPLISIADSRVDEGEDLVFDIVLDKPIAEDIVIQVSIGNPPALNADNLADSSDYNDITNSINPITIPANALSAQVRIPTIDDDLPENAETVLFFARATSNNTANISINATGTINASNNVKPTFTVENQKGKEGETLVFSIVFDKASTEDVELELNMINVTASNADYLANSVNITIPTGSMGVDVEIPLVEDKAVEEEETFKFYVTAVGNNTVNRHALAIGTIVDATETIAKSTLSIENVSANEGDDLAFEIRLDKISPTDIVFDVSVENISTTNSDYTDITSGNNVVSVTIPAGTEGIGIAVPTTKDAAYENEERFKLKVVVTSNNTTNNTVVAEGTIIDVTDSKIIYVSGNNSNNLDNYFKVTIVGTPTVSNGKITGKGTLHIPWLNADMGVAFKNIEVDIDRKLTSGVIKVEVNGDSPNQNLLKSLASGVANSSWTNSAVSGVQNFVNGTLGTKLNYKATSLATNVKLPFGIDFDKDGLVVAQMSFEKTTAKMTLIAGKKLPASWDSTKPYLGFKLRNIAFNKVDIVDFNNIKLELVENFTVNGSSTTNNSINFTFNKGNSNNGANPGCYIQLKNGDIDKFGLDISADLPRNWMFPEGTENGTQKTRVNLSANVDSWEEMILTGNLPKSTIANTDGMIIEASNIVFDMSSTLNYENIEFPTGYNSKGVTDITFQGFYGKDITLTLPDAWQNNSNVISLGLHNLIVTDKGVSLVANVHPDLKMNTSSVKLVGLAASLDQVSFSILNSTLSDASINGKIVLPITKNKKSAEANYALGYEAILHIANQAAGIDETNFSIIITPGTIDADIFGKAKIETTDGTYMKAYVSKTRKSFDVNINGQFVLNTNLDDKAPIKLAATVTGLGMNYNMNSAGKFNMKPGTWGFDDGCELVFPSSLADNNANDQPDSNGHKTGISFEKKGTISAGMKYEGTLKIGLALNLSKNISGFASIGLDVGVTDDFEPKYIGANLGTISIDGSSSVVDMYGELNFVNNQYGNGISAKIDVELKSVGGFGTKAFVEFGKSNFHSNDWYRYWHVELDVKTKVPFISPLVFNKFGGGAFRHMESVYNEQTMKYTFIPNKSVNLGLIARVGVETESKPETFNAIPELKAVFANGALQYISLGGNFAVGGKVEKIGTNDNPFLFGNVVATYNNQPKSFDFAANIRIPKDDLSIINTVGNQSVGLNFSVDRYGSRLLFGTPTEMNRVQVFGANIREYLMLGTSIPVARTYWDPNFASLYRENTGKSLNEIIPSQTRKVNGFAFGANFEFETTGGVIIVRGYGVGYKLNAAAQVDASLMDGYDCNGSTSNTGLNGWRAEGMLGLTAGVDVKYGKGRGSNKKEYIANHGSHLLHVGVGTTVQGGFPNPTYAKGSVDGTVEIACWDYDFSASFKVGEECARDESVDAVNLSELTLISDQTNLKKLNRKTIYSILRMKYNMPLNEVFPLILKFDGNEENRVEALQLKLISNVSLYIEKANRWQHVDVETSFHNDGVVWYHYDLERSSKYKFVVKASLLDADNNEVLKTDNREYVFYSIKYKTSRELVNSLLYDYDIDPWTDPLSGLSSLLVSTHMYDNGPITDPQPKEAFINVRDIQMFKNNRQININTASLLLETGIRYLDIVPEPEMNEHYSLKFNVEIGLIKNGIKKTISEINAMSKHNIENYVNNRIASVTSTKEYIIDIGDIKAKRIQSDHMDGIRQGITDTNGLNDVRDVLQGGGVVFPSSGGPNVVIVGGGTTPRNPAQGQYIFGAGNMTSSFLTSGSYNRSISINIR